MFETQIDTLSPDESLTYATELRTVSEAADTKLLQVAAHWADLHGVLDRPADTTTLPGMETMTRLGGQGTPQVAEFACAELGAELAMSPYAGQLLVADALDLRHRLPHLWARVRAGDVKPWVGRKAAQTTRDLSAATAAVVDTKVAPWADRLTWTRLENLIYATALATDPDHAQAQQDRVTRGHGVWVNPQSDLGTRSAFIRAEATTLGFFDAALDQAANDLRLLGDTSTRDVRRARALGVLADPHQALDLFHDAAGAGGSSETATPTQTTTCEAPGCRGGGGSRVDTRPRAVLYVHLNEDAVTSGTYGVGRLDGCGPVTSGQVRQFLGHCHVTVKPVIDIAGMAPVDGYEVTDKLREAVHLMTPADRFPFTTNIGRAKDIDHTIRYVPPDEGGPPGQTRIGNLAPLTRFPHRIKTHGRWQVRQPFPGIWIWRSPHGRHWLVDSTGSRRIPDPAA